MIVSPRDRVLAAISHGTLGRHATDYWGTPEATDMLLRHLGCDSTMEMYERALVTVVISSGLEAGLVRICP